MSLKYPLLASLAVAAALAGGPAFATDKPVDFVTKAAQGDMLEVKLAQLALKKSKNAEVRGFATRMITDHSKSEKELKVVAGKSHIRLPLKLDDDHRDKLNDFAKKGDSFDKDYIGFMADDHKDDVALYDDFAKNGQEPKLKEFAGKTLPVLVKHKDLVDGIKAKM